MNLGSYKTKVNLGLSKDKEKTSPQILIDNYAITKAIRFKSKKIASIDLVVDKTNETKINDISENQIKLLLDNPFKEVAMNELFENYFFGMFYDGIVYFIVVDGGVYIAREYEVNYKNEDNKITFRDQVYSVVDKKPKQGEAFIKQLSNKNEVNGETQPLYKEIVGTITEKFNIQALNVELTENGLVLKDIFINKGGEELSDEQQRSFAQKMKSKFSLGNKSYTKQEGSVVMLNGDWQYLKNDTTLAELDNTAIIKANNDIIYNFLDVPPQLMGSSESSTFSNYGEASKNFINNTVIPDLNTFLSIFNYYWLKGSGFKIIADFENIPELIEYKREQFNMLTTLFDAGIISQDQYLEESGFGSLRGGD